MSTKQFPGGGFKHEFKIAELFPLPLTLKDQILLQAVFEEAANRVKKCILVSHSPNRIELLYDSEKDYLFSMLKLQNEILEHLGRLNLPGEN